MDTEEFKKGLLDGLNKLTPEQIKKIHDEYETEGDCDIMPDGISRWLTPNHKLAQDSKHEPSEITDNIMDNPKTEKYGDYLVIHTPFLDDADDEIDVIYDYDNQRFTDDSYTAEEFSSRGFNLNSYTAQMKELFVPFKVYYDERNEEIVYKVPYNRDNLTLFAQMVIKVYAMLDLLHVKKKNKN